MRLLTKLRYSDILMYPQVSLINKDKSKLVVFERDLNNPLNEGFIVFWEIINLNNKHLIFKKRLNKIRAQNKLKKLQDEGWTKTNLLDYAA